MVEIYLALGSNVSDSEKNIKLTIKLLGEKITKIKSAPIYKSKAVGYTDQADFFNTAICGRTNLSAQELIKFTKKVEQKVGRVARFRWGPREIDIDIIFYDHQIINESGLHIPHPRFSERDFVLIPLCDLNPKLVDPVSQQTVQELYKKLPKDSHSVIV